MFQATGDRQADQGEPQGRSERLEKALGSSMAIFAAREADKTPLDWAALERLAPLQKPALAKAVAIAAGVGARDAARVACAWMDCEAPFKAPSWSQTGS